ncbi:Nicotinate phosphoribosyltransferase (NAPRTase) [sediment metagenome]|uniref:nicotinate phosphoribosyltransferase n=1 Tax=sediment metagenome TaxID=749907 RepID=D9PLJ9_9ZZZZ
MARKLAQDGIVLQGVRLDSGNLGDHARKVRHILDAGGLFNVTIFASGSLDEFSLAELVREEAPIDGFGVGTRMNTSADHPYLDCAYKLEEYAHVPRRKQSEGKATWPGRKQVYRSYDDEGLLAGDILTTADATQLGEPLLVPVMHRGQRLPRLPSLEAVREHARTQLARLPKSLRALTPATSPYRVTVAAPLVRLTAEIDKRMPATPLIGRDTSSPAHLC